MKTWAEVTDEHGELTDPSIPKLVYDEESLERWYICAELAENATTLPITHPEAILFATTVFQSDVPTHPPVIEESIGNPHFNARQWRNRAGEWIDMPDRPEAPKLKSGTPIEARYTLEDIAEAGLDKPPRKGPAAKAILGDASDTFGLYGPEEPSPDPRFPAYASDRSTKHDAYIAAEIEGKDPPGEHPHALFMAGGTASGKTTVLNENRGELAPPPINTIHIDVDRIKEDMGKFGMPEYDEMREAGDHYAATAVHREAGDIAAKLMRKAMEMKFHVIIDGTGDSDPGMYRDQLEEVKETGYSVDVLYVNRSTNESIALAIGRYRARRPLRPRADHPRAAPQGVDQLPRRDLPARLAQLPSGLRRGRRDRPPRPRRHHPDRQAEVRSLRGEGRRTPAADSGSPDQEGRGGRRRGRPAREVDPPPGQRP